MLVCRNATISSQTFNVNLLIVFAAISSQCLCYSIFHMFVSLRVGGGRQCSTNTSCFIYSYKRISGQSWNCELQFGITVQLPLSLRRLMSNDWINSLPFRVRHILINLRYVSVNMSPRVEGGTHFLTNISCFINSYNIFLFNHRYIKK